MRFLTSQLVQVPSGRITQRSLREWQLVQAARLRPAGQLSVETLGMAPTPVEGICIAIIIGCPSGMPEW
jgi:hypothetical protein